MSKRKNLQTQSYQRFRALFRVSPSLSYIESSNSIKGYKVKKSLRVRAVAYSSGTHTALGTKLRYGVIAVDPKVIPYRTKVYIKELDRVFVAEDCGGGIKGKIIDIYMPSEAQCNRWGSRNITIQILK